MGEIKASLEVIADVFHYILNPLEFVTMVVDYLMGYIPSVCIIIFIFYIVTGSKKVLNTLSFTILFYILIKMAFIFNMTSLVIVVVLAVILIRFIGVVL